MPKAAVCSAASTPLEIRDLELAPPGAGEVRVRIAAAGICHTDKSAIAGAFGFPHPFVPGHEAAGVITGVGSGVTTLREGDHVVLSFVPQCGCCFYCTGGQPELCELPLPHLLAATLLDGTTRLRDGQTDVHQAGFIGAFSEETVVPEIAAVKIPDDVPLSSAALIGCAVLTGVGAAIKTGRVARGETVAVVGCGGVGLNAVQGARLAGAERIIAVDTNADKLAMSLKYGATDTVDAAREDPVEAVQRLTGRGVDVGIEVVGSATTIAQTATMTRRGGRVVLVGMPAPEVAFPIPAAAMVQLAQTTIGCAYGSADIRTDVNKYIDWYRRGDLILDDLVSATIGLDQVNEGLASVGSGALARTVIVAQH